MKTSFPVRDHLVHYCLWVNNIRRSFHEVIRVAVAESIIRINAMNVLNAFVIGAAGIQGFRRLIEGPNRERVFPVMALILARPCLSALCGRSALTNCWTLEA